MDKTIRAEEAAYEGFRQLAKEYELSNPGLLAAMVQYFRVTPGNEGRPPAAHRPRPDQQPRQNHGQAGGPG